MSGPGRVDREHGVPVDEVRIVAEIPMDGVAPAVGNAILDAVGVNVDEIPVTPEKVWRVLKNK